MGIKKSIRDFIRELNMKKFGKKNLDLIKIKKSFFNENDYYLNKQLKDGNIYLQQDVRTKCENCDNQLDTSSDFKKQEIPYLICKRCTHLNGRHKNSQNFINSLYTDEGDVEYSKIYNSKSIKDFQERSESIYLPKVQFLIDSLIEKKLDISNLKFCDFGCGSGYFLHSLDQFEVGSLIGYEVSKIQMKLGNKFLGKKLIQNYNITDTIDIIKNIESDVISLIAVLEHLKDPREILMEIKNNTNIKFMMISVPTFSFSTYLEVFSQEVFSRQLSSGHTHLYTKESIKYLIDEFDFSIISEWWFGTDIVDLYRHFMVIFEKSKYSDLFIESFKKTLIPLIDNLQLEFDKQKKSSEVHLVVNVQ